MRTKWFVLLVATFAALTLWGCGSNGGSGGSDVASGDDPGSVDSVGIQNCTVCHEGFRALWDESTNNHNNGNDRPDLAYFGRDGCDACHDSTGDSANVHPARPVVGCESCHGGGSAHRGVGPIPYPYPDPAQCAVCHDAHGYSLGTAVLNSAHNNADDLHASTTRCQRCHTKEGSIALSQYTGDADVMHLMDDVPPVGAEEDLHPVTCSTCHGSHNGALKADSFIVNDNALATGDWDPNANGVADQFDFCTSCHVYYNQDGDLIGSGEVISGSSPIFPGTNDTPVPWSIDTAPFYHNTAWYRTIPTTHFDNPLTGPQVLDRSGNLNQSTLVEGYVIRQTINGTINENPCFDCHGHELRTNTRHSMDEPEADDNPADYGSTIQTQWASSAHAAGLLGEKYATDSGSRDEANVDAVMMAAASDDTSGGGFTHYNWDRTGRSSCQMCHTATGAANFLMNPGGYDASANDFSHLADWVAADGSPQNELLYCWGCHEDAGTGELREPGAITLAYLNMVPENPTLPDMGGSNVCLNCHSGRGGMYKQLGGDAADPNGPAEQGGTDTHYYASGGTIYQELTNIGYMYFGAGSYDDPSYYGHDSLGCADCHMTSEESHTYQVVGKDDTDTIVAIVSKTCVSCHDGEHALFVAESQVGTTQDIWNGTASVPTTVSQVMADDAAAEMEHEAHGYHDALDALGAVLTVAGTPPSPNYPYFSGNATDQGHGGAMHNHSYLHHEPGGYAHNRFYAKRLIFDSIDWLSNPTDGGLDTAGSRTLDGAIFLDPATYDAAIVWLGGDPATGIIDSRP